MNICLLCNEYPPISHGGIGTFVKNLAHKLTQKDVFCLVVGYDSTVNRTFVRNEEGVVVVRIKSPYESWGQVSYRNYRFNLAFILERLYLSRQIARYGKDYNINLVESYDWSGPLLVRPQFPMVVRMHGANTAYRYYEKKAIGRLLKYVERRNVDMASHLVAVSKHIGSLTLQALDLPYKRYDVIYNGVDVDFFRPPQLPRNDHQILYVGTISRRKGVYELFRAFNLVLASCPDAQLVLAGKLPGGDAGSKLVSELMSILQEKDHSKVIFLGHVPYQNIPFIYGQAALTIVPSHAEAFGLTCVEAMACGTPVVMTSKASGPEIVEDGVSGLLIDPTSPQSIANAAIRLLKDDDLRYEIGNQGRERVVQCFDQDKIIDQNIEMYCNILRR